MTDTTKSLNHVRPITNGELIDLLQQFPREVGVEILTPGFVSTPVVGAREQDTFLCEATKVILMTYPINKLPPPKPSDEASNPEPTPVV